MSANVRTSSRIQARKSKIVSVEAETPPSSKKRKNEKDIQVSPSQQGTTRTKAIAAQHATASPAQTTIPTTATSTTPSSITSKISHTPAQSTTPPAKPSVVTTSSTTSMSTRSSGRTISTSKEDELNELVEQDPNTQTDIPTKTTTAVPQQTVQVSAPTHIFKNPNFTHSGKWGSSTGKKTRTWKTLKQIIASERAQLYRPVGSTYSSIDAPPSRKPAKKYSDISGLPARYTDPRTKLRYANAEEFAQLRVLPVDIVNGLLALRRANLDVQ